MFASLTPPQLPLKIDLYEPLQADICDASKLFIPDFKSVGTDAQKRELLFGTPPKVPFEAHFYAVVLALLIRSK